jgi:type VI secretion system protein VasG
MAEIKRSVLFDKLDLTAYDSVKSATILCKMRGSPYVKLLPRIFQLFQLADLDLHTILEHFGDGMRDAILTRTFLAQISRELHTRLMEGRSPQKVDVTVKDGIFAYH